MPGMDQAAPHVDTSAANMQQPSQTIDKPGRLTLRADNGDVLKEAQLEKLETNIGRAPNSDILLSKDKLTSRRPATIKYENENYVLRNEGSTTKTFFNWRQI